MNKVFARVQSGADSVPRFIRFFVTTLWLCAGALAHAQNATVAWNPPNNGPIAGYYVYYGSESHNYTNVLDVDTNTVCTVGGLMPGTNYYFAVSSYTADGVESDLSSEVTLVVAPFFAGEVPLGGNVQYLHFSGDNFFGFYNNTYYPWIYHYNLGFEYVIEAHDEHAGVYFYDAASGSFWFTNPSLFPYLYDFTLKSWLYYYPDTTQANSYTSKPRLFYVFSQGKIITK